MNAAANAPATRLVAPRLSLASCVRAFVVRNTVVAPLSDPADRLNRYPATPLCSLGLAIEGLVEMIDPPPPDPLPDFVRAIVVGPQLRPTITSNPGPVQMLYVMLYPQAMHALCGVEVSAWVDNWAPVATALGPEWAAMCEAAMAAQDDHERIAIIEDFLEPRWQAARPTGPGANASEWVRHLAAQAAGTAFGRGARNIERRIKTWAGLPMRTLRRMQRAEQSFFDARGDHQDGRPSLADVAARRGYSDQAHLSREAREITGHSPSELVRELAGADESYWIYRIWY